MGGRRRFARVRPEDAARRGEPFRAFLEALRTYRAARGRGPVAPWARQRICTAYLKIRVQRSFGASLWPEWSAAVGLRADEPERVARLSVRENKHPKEVLVAPLAVAGVTKADVLRFWSRQTFDLMLREHEGNCTKCFLKSESELADSFAEYPDDNDVWLGMEADFGVFGKHGLPYATIAAEAPMRRELIRPMVRAGLEPAPPEGFDPRRFRLLVLQERRRLREGDIGFSCACEAASVLDIEDP